MDNDPNRCRDALKFFGLILLAILVVAFGVGLVVWLFVQMLPPHLVF